MIHNCPVCDSPAPNEESHCIKCGLIKEYWPKIPDHFEDKVELEELMGVLSIGSIAMARGFYNRLPIDWPDDLKTQLTLKWFDKIITQGTQKEKSNGN